MVPPGLRLLLPLLVLSVRGAASSAETRVTKRDGETLTLRMKITMLPVQNYLWQFGHNVPHTPISIVTRGEVTRVNGTRFENRLHTHVESGSITISNLTVGDSGIFMAQVMTETGILTQRFNLTVRENSVDFRRALEKNNVTLDTGVTELQKDHTVDWTQGPDFDGKLIARWKNQATFIEESFEGVLQLSPHTGSLTIIGVTLKQTGYYCVKLLLGRETHIMRQYSLQVYEPVSMPHISAAQANITTYSLTDGNCYINCSVKNGPDVTESWYKGEKKINQTSNKDVSTNLTLPLEIQRQNEGIYHCVAANPVSQEEVTVNSTQWCPASGAGSKRMWWIIGETAVAVAVAVFVLLVVAYLCKQRKKERATICVRWRATPEKTPSVCASLSEGSNEAQEQEGLLINGLGNSYTL